jgi:hypothetical protein
MASRQFRGWSIAVGIGLAAVFSIWSIAVMASDLMREDSHPPLGLYFLWLSLLSMFWSGLSLLRWRTNLAIVVLLLSAIYAPPLGMFVILFRLGLTD